MACLLSFKQVEAFIDSSATHYLFLDRKGLQTYELITNTVAAAVRDSELVGAKDG